MRSNYFLTPVAACIALTMVSSVNAAVLVPLEDTSLSTLQQQFHLGLPGAAKASTANSMQFVSEHKDMNRISHVRMQQLYHGFPVFGGFAIVHAPHSAKQLLNAQDNSSITGRAYSGLETDLGQPSANFIQNGDTALAQFKSQFAGKNVSETQVTPMIYLDDQQTAHWAYKVSLLVTHTDQIPERPSAIIDATTFKPFVTWNDIKTFEGRTSVRGKGYGGNLKMGKLRYGTRRLPYLDITRDNANQMCFMENTGVRVVDMMHKYSSNGAAMTFSCLDKAKSPTAMHKTRVYNTGYNADGYDEDNGAYSPTNDAFYAGYVIKHMYFEWYNVEALTNPDGTPMQLVMRVHYGQNYENAYWDGRQMTFGDGESFFHPLTSLGVSSHEVSHGFTQQHSDLSYWGQSGGMNESFSDMAAMAAEYYTYGKSSWLVGAEIVKVGNRQETLRYMDVPSKDGRSIDSAKDYRSGLDVHYSSGVYNRLYYLISNQEGWNAKRAFDVMVKANMDYWGSNDTFNQAACGVLSAAKDLGWESELDAIKKSMDMVDVKYTQCKI